MADLEQLKKLREEFPPNQISKLPKETKNQRLEREADMSKGIKCQLCGGWHHKNAVHLDYVGHAAATDRLLDVDPMWAWEPVAKTPDGLPALDKTGGLWISLTVCGVTRLGYGNAEGKTGGDAIKEIIGDAIRNAGMRFGMALDLWHKGDLHAHEEEALPSAADRFMTEAEGALRAAKTLDELKAVFISRTNKDAREIIGAEGVAKLTNIKDAKKTTLEGPAENDNPFESVAA